MSVAAYMTYCLHDPVDGYYASRPALGRDFATAPEVSQVFGELLGVWVVHEWRALGSPDRFHLIELGPGRGVMMADVLRAAARVPDFLAALELALVEASPVLRQEQSARLAAYSPRHVDALARVPGGPSLIIANEFLDCMPIRQLVRTEAGWRERSIGLGEDGALSFGVGLPAEPPGDLRPNGNAVEFAPGLEAITDAISLRLKSAPGRALFVDYGPDDRSPDDSLRAFTQGVQVHPLESPGASDLTADVDFGRVVSLLSAAEVDVAGPVGQGDFLRSLGAAERFETLAARNPERAEALKRDLLRLTAPDEMGTRFKAICASSRDLIVPAGF